MKGGIFRLWKRVSGTFRSDAEGAAISDAAGAPFDAPATPPPLPDSAARVYEFSLGPVQSWVGQARRTRDLWAGSFLLAWLSARAAAAALAQDEQGDRIVLLPRGTVRGHLADASGGGDAMVRAELARLVGGTVGEIPLIGSMPNHFSVGVPAGVPFDPERCVAAVYEGWWLLADTVYSTFVEPLPKDSRTAADTVWRTQIGRLKEQPLAAGERVFWEVLWAAAEHQGADDHVRDFADASARSLLGPRKAWRDHVLPVMANGQTPCSLIPNWAEASGLPATRRGKEAQAAFWQAVRTRVADVVYGNPEFITLDLRDNERLSPIALVKRLFPLLPAQRIEAVFGGIPGGALPGETVRERERACRDRLSNWPSTAFIAAVPWIRAAWEQNPGACEAYHQAQRSVIERKKIKAEAPTVPKIAVLASSSSTKEGAAFAGMDGALFHDRSVQAFFKVKDGGGDRATDDAGDSMARNFAILRDNLRDSGFHAAPSNFYALLKMDGDRAGVALGEPYLGRIMPKVLDGFSAAVPGVVAKHRGMTIYAGGDDVLALLPVNTALAAACALEAEWTRLFHEQRVTVLELARDDTYRCTISAGIAFADYQIPLSRVRQEADRLLDGVAKTGNNRNSIALGLLRRGGHGGEWVAAWKSQEAPINGATRSAAAERSPVGVLSDLAIRFQSAPELTQHFFYKVKERFGQLMADGRLSLPQSALHALLVAEYIEGPVSAQRRDEVATLMADLLYVAQAHPQPAGQHPFDVKLAEQKQNDLRLDAFWIIRFLAANCIPQVPK